MKKGVWFYTPDLHSKLTCLNILFKRFILFHMNLRNEEIGDIKPQAMSIAVKVIAISLLTKDPTCLLCAQKVI